MDRYQPSLASRFSALLERRIAELQGELGAHSGEPAERGVTDFKEMAQELTQAEIDEVQIEHAKTELAQLLAARGRLEQETYGICQACGDSIDLRRLEAMPAAAYCTACQALREQR